MPQPGADSERQKAADGDSTPAETFNVHAGQDGRRSPASGLPTQSLWSRRVAISKDPQMGGNWLEGTAVLVAYRAAFTE